VLELLVSLELVARLLIDLSEQRLYAYDATDRLVYSALVSTGLPATPTPAGEFSVGSKYAETSMRGRDYFIPSLPLVMCLIGGGLRPGAFCIHPAPWQENAGQAYGVRRSHGCIRTTTATARWLFSRTRVGTPVTIQH
jgi:lipoprotein-anchoring transpeptidase ErfK/SrfK